MSKESYIRGFCKAAEAAGVDPVGLAKFADAIYNTGGKLPSSTIKNLGGDGLDELLRRRRYIYSRDAIPSINTRRNGRLGVDYSSPAGILYEYKDALSRLADGVDRKPIDEWGHGRPPMSQDEQTAWLKAHTQSLRAAQNVMRRKGYFENDRADPAAAYHGSMFALTNDVPATIASPSGK